MLNVSMKNGIVALVDKSARLVGQRVAGARHGDLDRLLGQMNENQSAASLLTEVWHAADLDGTSVRLHNPTPANLPFAIYGANFGWCLVQSRGADGVWRGEGIDGVELSLKGLDDVECVSLPRRSAVPNATPGAMRLVRRSEERRVGKECRL